MRKIILVSEISITLPNVQIVSKSDFLSSSNWSNAYVLIDRCNITTKEVYAIKSHCQNIGLCPMIDGSMFDASYVIVPDWSEETEELSYSSIINESVKYLEECEMSAKLFELEDKKPEQSKVKKLLALAKDSASSFGEKRNAINFAYKMVFGV